VFKVLKFPNVCNECVAHVCNFVNNNKSINGFLSSFVMFQIMINICMISSHLA
jgi:hypothetical protein